MALRQITRRPCAQQCEVCWSYPGLTLLEQLWCSVHRDRRSLHPGMQTHCRSMERYITTVVLLHNYSSIVAYRKKQQYFAKESATFWFYQKISPLTYWVGIFSFYSDRLLHWHTMKKLTAQTSLQNLRHRFSLSNLFGTHICSAFSLQLMACPFLAIPADHPGQ